MTTEITVEQVRHLLTYEPDTGRFFWRVSSGPRIVAGDSAGSPNGGGYHCIGLFNRKIKAHRLAWLYTYGEWPTVKVDHINGNGLDNRLANLRLATHAQNHQNRRTPNKGTLVGLLGVDIKKGKYRARITLGGKQKHIGYFDTAESAHAAYVSAKRDIHPFGTL